MVVTLPLSPAPIDSILVANDNAYIQYKVMIAT